jgi:hypothetical protein
MLYAFVLYTALIGPQEDSRPKQTIYILVDTQDTRPQSKDVVHQSKIIKSELTRNDFEQERYYLKYRWNIVIEEYGDKNSVNKQPLPSFKFMKNADYEPFCPGTFKASGTFILALYDICKWEFYINDLMVWRMWLSRVGGYYTLKLEYKQEWAYKGGKRNITTIPYWIIQPPSHPNLYNKTYEYYGYQDRFLDPLFLKPSYMAKRMADTYTGKESSEPNLDIKTEEGMGNVFWLEYSDLNLWYCGEPDITPAETNVDNWMP